MKVNCEQEIVRINALIEIEKLRYVLSLDREDPYSVRNDILKRLKILKLELVGLGMSQTGVRQTSHGTKI